MTGYLGSKQVSGAYQAVIANMPPHDTYIEMSIGVQSGPPIGAQKGPR